MTTHSETDRRLFRTLSIATSFLAMTAIAASAQVNRSELSEFVRLRSEESRRLRALMEVRASEMRIPIRARLANGAIVELKRFVGGRPLYYITDNLNAARTVSTDRVWSGGGLGLFLDGAGQTLGIWDGGNVRATHVELAGRVTNFDSSGLDNHATHVAGTMIAGGIDAGARGMAFAGNLVAYDFNSDETEMAQEQLKADPIKVSNHSYSFIGGWINNFFGDGRWVWFGDVAVGSTEDHSFGYYDASARDWDQIAFDSPNYLMVKSAGNDRNDAGPAPGVVHWHFDSGVGSFVLSSDTHPADGGATGFDSMAAGSASSKNILTVGAVQDVPGGYVDPAGVVMSSFSGWGPTDDGRIKPDLVANGIGLRSSVAGSDSAYASFSGTSMSSPSTAGSLGVLGQHAEDLFGGPLRASTMRALVLHTADEAGPSDGPDYMFGWGLLNTASAALVMSDHAAATSTEHIVELELNDGAVETFQFSSDGAGPFRVTIAWTDPPGTPPPGVIDPPNLMLVNDVDITVVDPDGVTHSPWVLDPAVPSAAATTGDNFRDNVEQIHVDATLPGVYTVQMSHKSALSGGAPQPVSLIVSGNADTTVEPTEIIIDDLDPSTARTGNWRVSSGPKPWAGQSVFNDSGNIFRWLPTIPVTGTYEVYAWWTFHSNRSTTVPYRISHAGGTTETFVNQRNSSLGGQWNLIGTVPMNAGTGHYVEVSSENGQASADAVRLVRVDTAPPPLTVVTTSLPDATVGVPYRQTLTASGGTLPYTWSVVSGSLPDGLSLDPVSGEIGGTPTTEGGEAFIVGVDDGGGDHAEALLNVTVSAAPTEIIIDNLDASTTQTGTWSVSSGPNPWAGQSVYNNSGKIFRWLPTIPVTGTYQVYAWWTFHSNRSTTVPYRISHAGGTTETIVNQRDSSLGGQWNLIGTVPMNAGSGHYVEVSSENGQASADAVRLVFVDTAPTEIIVDNLDADTTQTGTWSVSSGKNPWAGQSVYNDGGNIFRWLPTIPETGTYQVYAWWTFHSNRSTAVPYRISHAGGTTETIVNQRDSSLGGQWNLIGTVPLNAGSGHYVEVSSENGQASADAIRLVRQ